MRRFKCLPSPNSMTGVALLGACVQAAAARLPHLSARALADDAIELYEELDAALDSENNEAVSV